MLERARRSFDQAAAMGAFDPNVVQSDEAMG